MRLIGDAARRSGQGLGFGLIPIVRTTSAPRLGDDWERSESLVPEAELTNPFSQLRIYRADIGSRSAEILSCKCGGLLTPFVALLPRARVELTAIACLKCRTITTVRNGVIFPDAEKRPRRGVASNTTVF